MLRFAAAAALLSGCVGGAAAVREIKCDFTRGIPADWTLIDGDANTLSQDVARFGFSQGDAWVAYRIEAEDNAVACSTSWYDVAGTSSDWMILPDLQVDEASVLSWRAKAADKRFRDGYAVYVAPAGASRPDDFVASAPLFSVEAEEGEWTPRSVSLAAYAGQTVRVAFVNNSTDCQCLFIDDVAAGTPSPLTFESTIPNFSVVGRELQVTGYVVAGVPESLKGARFTLDIDGRTFSQDFPDLVLEPGKRVPINWMSGYVPDAKGDYPFTFSVEAGGLNGSVSGLVRSVTHKVVMEEGTGTWCSWCVRGIVAMEALQRKYPDNFIGIAVHSNDAMALDNYTVEEVFGRSSVPKAKINRGEALDPSQAVTGFERVLAATPVAALDFSLAYDKASGRIDTETEVSFADFYADKDYRLAYVVIENDVHHPGDNKYCQGNAYAGGGEGPMGGFEDKPASIPSEDMWFQEVARGLMSPFGGVGDIIPRSMKALQTATHSYSFTLPAAVENLEKARVIVMLVDNGDGHILNAEIVPLAVSSAVEAMENYNFRIVPLPGGLRLDGVEVIESYLYSIDGTLLARGEDTLSCDVSGLALLRVVTPSGILTRKIIMRNFNE